MVSKGTVFVQLIERHSWSCPHLTDGMVVQIVSAFVYRAGQLGDDGKDQADAQPTAGQGTGHAACRRAAARETGSREFPFLPPFPSFVVHISPGCAFRMILWHHVVPVLPFKRNRLLFYSLPDSEPARFVVVHLNFLWPSSPLVVSHLVV